MINFWIKSFFFLRFYLKESERERERASGGEGRREREKQGARFGVRWG